MKPQTFCFQKFLLLPKNCINLFQNTRTMKKSTVFFEIAKQNNTVFQQYIFHEMTEELQITKYETDDDKIPLNTKN